MEAVVLEVLRSLTSTRALAEPLVSCQLNSTQLNHTVVSSAPVDRWREDDSEYTPVFVRVERSVQVGPRQMELR